MPVTVLFRIPDAARLLALQPSTLRKLIARGHVGVSRPSPRAVRVPESEIVRLQAVARERTRDETTGGAGSE